MSATDVFENGMLSLIFENANYANVGDATGLRGSTGSGSFYISLSTGTLTDTSTQATTETTYTGYARVAVARSTAGWSVAAGVADNDAAITYGLCSAGSGTVTDFGVGSDSTAAGNLFVYGVLTASLAISAGITPAFAIGALDVTLT